MCLYALQQKCAKNVCLLFPESWMKGVLLYPPKREFLKFWSSHTTRRNARKKYWPDYNQTKCNYELYSQTKSGVPELQLTISSIFFFFFQYIQPSTKALSPRQPEWHGCLNIHCTDFYLRAVWIFIQPSSPCTIYTLNRDQRSNCLGLGKRPFDLVREVTVHAFVDGCTGNWIEVLHFF